MSLDLRGFERQLAKANGTTTRELNKIERKFQASQKKIQGIFTGFARGFAGGFIGGGVALFGAKLAETIGDAVKQAAMIGDIAQDIGITTTALQELQFGAVQANLGFEELTSGLQRFSKAQGEARTGSGDLAEIFKANNIPLTDDYNENLRIMADLIRNAANEQDQMLLVTKAFGKEGKNWLQFLRNGREGLDGMQKAARDAHFGITPEFVKMAQEIDDQWAALMLRLTTSIQQWALGVIAQFRTVGREGIGGMIEQARQRAREQGIELFGTVVKQPLPVEAIRAGSGNVDVLAAAQKLIQSQQQRTGGRMTTVIPSEASKAAIKAEAENAKVFMDAMSDAEREFVKSIDEANQKIQQQADELKSLATSAMQSFVSDIMNGVDAVDALTNSLKKLLEQLVQVAIQRGMTALLGQGGTPGLFQFHRGGIVGKGGTRRSGISPFVFAGAQRMHNGGLAGNEVPAILKKGEVVLPGMPRMGGGANVEINIVNKSSAEIQQTQRSGPDGQRIFEIAVMDVVGRKLPNLMTTRFGIGPRLQQRG